MILLLGRTATGKDLLRQELEKKGMRFVKSCTTRPKRTPDEDTHIFVTEEEANEETDKVATTVINGYEYFATRSQVQACDAYIIDPFGARELMANMPEEEFLLAYLCAADAAMQEKMAVSRASDPETERVVFQSRYNSENKEFSLFERFGMKNCIVFVNHYEDGEMEKIADCIVSACK